MLGMYIQIMDGLISGLKSMCKILLSLFLFVFSFHLLAHYIFGFDQLSVTQLLLSSIFVAGIRKIGDES